MPAGDPIKISRLVLRNTSARARRISVTGYVEWVLAPSRTASMPFVTTGVDAATGALFARNAWQPAFGARVAFADFAGRQTDWTGDRREFIGRNGDLTRPAALAGKAGRSMSPAGAAKRRPRTMRSMPP